MQNKLLFFLFLITPLLSNSQEYVDILNISYSKTGNTNFGNTSDKSSISIFDSKITLPIVVNEKTAIITGFDFSIKKLQFFPNDEFSKLYYTRIKLGISTQHSDRWGGTYILLPVLSSDYKNVNSKDIFMGLLTVWTYKKHKNLNYKFGLYSGNEAYGLYITPIIGMYYISPNSNFEISALIPGLFDMNLGISNKVKLGIDYKGVSETFNLYKNKSLTTYTENRTLEFSSYIQNNSLNKNLIMRLKLGFTTNNFDVYAVDDKIDLSITPFKIGDKRTKLNTNLNSSTFLRIEAIYRFNITSK